MALKDKTNEVLIGLVQKLKGNSKQLWKRVAEELSKPRNSRVEVNLKKLDACGEEKDILLVPGKVLGAGQLTKKLTVAAFAFSGSARKLISEAGGKIISLEELYSTNPEGKGIVIIK